MNLNWFIGFVEGEGNFTISFGIRHDCISSRAYFQISQAEREILGKIKDFLSLNQIQSSISKLTTPDMWILQVYRHSALLKLTKLLEPVEWYSKKGESFKKWKEGLGIILNKPDSMSNLKTLTTLAREINTSRGGRHPIWTPEYIERNCFSKDGKVMLVNSRGY